MEISHLSKAKHIAVEIQETKAGDTNGEPLLNLSSKVYPLRTYSSFF